jgi:hypothetical protein
MSDTAGFLLELALFLIFWDVVRFWFRWLMGNG